MQGKAAIVTGAGEGIGRAIALMFAQEGASVVVANRTPHKGESVVEEIRRLDGQAIYFRTDVRREPDAQNLIVECVSHFGRLDVLCNNAGVDALRSVTETTEEDYDLIMDTNLKGALWCCKHAIPEMMRNGGGSVVNVVSVSGLMPGHREAPYCASKGGLLMLTKQMALDYAPHQIRANAICPGFVLTPMAEQYFDQQLDPEAARREVEKAHPLGFLGTPKDVAYLAVYLASDESRWVTGAAFVIDGGLMIQTST